MGAAIPYIFMAAGAAYSFYGSDQQRKSALFGGEMDRYMGNIQREIYRSNARQYEMEAEMALGDAAYMMKAGEINAISAEREAINVRRKTVEVADQLRREGSQIMGSQVSKYSKGGVEISGTPLAVIKETANELEKDIASVLVSGSDEEFRALSTAAVFRLEGKRGQISATSGANRARSAAGLSRAYGEQAYLGGIFGEISSRYQAEAIRNQQYTTILNMGSNMYSYGGLSTRRV